MPGCGYTRTLKCDSSRENAYGHPIQKALKAKVQFGHSKLAHRIILPTLHHKIMRHTIILCIEHSVFIQYYQKIFSNLNNNKFLRMWNIKIV